MPTTHDATDATDADADARETARQENIERLDGLSVGQLYEVLELMKIMGAAPSDDNPDLATRMQRLRDDLHITDEEFAEFDRILRDHDEAEKRWLASQPHE